MGINSSDIVYFTNNASGAGGVIALSTKPGASESARLNASGDFGVGTNSPSARIHAISTTEQLRIGYDSSNYAASTTSSVGATTTALVGTTPSAKWTVSDATTNAIYDVATFF